MKGPWAIAKLIRTVTMSMCLIIPVSAAWNVPYVTTVPGSNLCVKALLPHEMLDDANKVP